MAKDERGGIIASGIVPDGNVMLFTPAMLWGADSLELRNPPDTKIGLVVLWVRPGLPIPADYQVMTHLMTDAEDLSLPGASPQLEAFPNPCTDVIAARLLGNGHRAGMVELRDLIGRRVAIAHLPETQVESDIREAWLDVSALPPGVYLLSAPGTSAVPRCIVKYR
jgi:hypothetical protein